MHGINQKTVNENNKLRIEDRAVHDWYRFVLSFPPHLVRYYIERFELDSDNCVLDPFCGTGTTLVECKKTGIESIGIEANPMAYFASKIKVDWSVDPEGLLNHANRIAILAAERLTSDGIEDYDDLPLFHTGKDTVKKLRTLSDETFGLLLKNSISPLPLHKILVLLNTMQEIKDERFLEYERLALAKALVFHVSNLNFGPEVGVGSIKLDAPVVPIWLNIVREMAKDVSDLQSVTNTEAYVYKGDARKTSSLIKPNSIDAVITSPPYPNEKDYTRTTRLESVLLGFIKNKEDLRALKKNMVRSNTRGVYKGDNDDILVEDHKEIQRIADMIEKRRLELGKTSGFERLYSKVTRLYFGGMALHLAELRNILRPGAKLAYVVGDQASYLRVMIRTGQILADIAKSLGYQVRGIDLFRTRLATATKEQLREEVVLLWWPGNKI
ncbi:MAG: DNA methyltransferase [Candidatus Glassbacteria bacterium]|nr:DNA methyltransferase [Candidatus Glassbacteria bacterium]